jgi:serine/threonine protein kinase
VQRMDLWLSVFLIKGLTYHGSSSDIWSCGIILFALLTGRLPFDDEDIRVLLGKVKIGKFIMPSDLPSDAKDLISRMLEVNPAKRITVSLFNSSARFLPFSLMYLLPQMEEIQEHPWFTRLPPRCEFLAPPTPDQIDRPVANAGEIDPDILSNLRTLWHGTPDDEIVDALVSKECALAGS